MFQTVIIALNEGFLKTFEIFCVTLLGALPLGLIIAFGSMSRWRPLKWFVKTLVWVVRGTPLMLQLLIIFYGPGKIFGYNIWGTGDWGRNAAVFTAFILNYACYFSEIYRGGIESIPRGQYEAGQVLGMTKAQIFFKVVLFQVIKRIVPPMGNEIITLVKDTSLARVIAVVELVKAAETIVSLKSLIWPLFYVGAFYLLFTGIVTLLLNYAEKKLNYYQG